MNRKRMTAGICSLLMLFSLTACKTEENVSGVQEQTTVFNGDINEILTENVSNIESTILNTTTATSSTSSEYNARESSEPVYSEVTDNQTKPEETTTQEYDDPCNWSKARIVEEYKKAARKSNSTAKSKQSIVLKEIKVNDGEYDKFFNFVTPIIAKFLESNSTEKTGITGGFENLVAEDVSSAKAYRSGNDTVIEMYMVEQTSGPKEDALSGSVGHAITSVGDISEVVKDLEERGLPLELSEEDTKIYYTNPVVKVTVNDNGEIISGTWSYTVEISMNNFKAFGKNVEKGTIIMENTIIV